MSSSPRRFLKRLDSDPNQTSPKEGNEVPATSCFENDVKMANRSRPARKKADNYGGPKRSI